MSHLTILILALLLDAAIGEPRWLWSRLPHPAVLMGNAVAKLDNAMNQGPSRQMAGVICLAILVVGAWGTGKLLELGGWPIALIVTAILLAQRSLVEHIREVATGLRMSLPQGRRAVAMIVSRDTKGMDEAAVARSAIESGAENLSDGVIAPAFWFLVAGLPGLLIYKVVNTADSMIGYRTARYESFGKAAALTDDLLNWIPARLTAVLIAWPAGQLKHWPAINQDAKLHKSPNAGWPEAAMARALHVALAGPRTYNGKTQDFPWVHVAGNRAPGPKDIDAAIARLWQAWGVMVAGLFALSLLMRLL